MPQTLQLEYACTKKEIGQAQTLAIHKQLGGGSKVRARIMLFLIVAIVLAGFYFEVQNFPASGRWYILGGAFMIAVVFVFLKNKSRSRRRNALSKLEVTEAGLTVLAGDMKVTSPWSAFSDCMES